jgi:hypothetical protein
VEEALLAVQQNKPLYLASLLGGASEQLVAAVEGRAMPEEFCPPTRVDQLYHNPPVIENNPGTRDDRTIDRVAIWHEFTEAGRGRIAQNNRLSREENNELLRTPVVERAIELVLTGLSRIGAARREG